MRRSIIIAVSALAVIVVGALVYFFFFTGHSASVTVSPGGTTSFPAAGQAGAPTGTTGGTVPGGTGGGAQAVTARLVKISAGPVVPGEVVTDEKAANASSSPEAIVRFIERESGNIFSYTTGSRTLTRTSNKTVPGIQSASWLPDATAAFVRYLSGGDFSTINTYLLPTDGNSGSFLPQDLAHIAVSSRGVLELASGVNGSTVSLAHPDGSRASTIFATPLSSVTASFLGRSSYLLATKPTASLPGTAFIADSSGRLSRIAGPLPGLTVLPSPSGKWLLASSASDGSFSMSLINTDTGEVLPLPVATIADKCVWADDDSSIYCGIPVNPSPSFAYPDDWYQGAAHFSDRIWNIRVSGRYAQFVLDFSKETGADLDAIGLAVDPANTTLVFVNKNDGSLWSYTL